MYQKQKLLLIIRSLLFLTASAFIFSCNGKPEPEKKVEVKPDAETLVEGTGHFLNLSDIHFNAFYDKSLVENLYNSPPSTWKGIFESSTITKADGTDDTNYPLLNSFLTSAQQNIAQPDFILISGDFIAHEYNSSASIAPFAEKAGVDENEWHANFIKKTLEFMAGEMKSRFPGVPVIPALGNNDAYCGDYHVQPDGDFLKDIAAVWGPLLPEDKGTFEQTFIKNGCYALDAPFNPEKIRIISLNTILLSANFNETWHDFFCTPGQFGPENNEPGTEMLTWAQTEINAATAKGQETWLIFHIPPGNDPNSCTGKSYYKTDFNDRFIKFLIDNAGSVKASYAGHYHRDDFRVVAAEENGKMVPKDFVHIGPAITTIYGNNPGYQVVHYEKSDGSLTDYSTYYTSLENATENPVWSDEYTFSSSYPGYSLEANSLWKLHDEIMQPGEIQDEYNAYYNGHPAAKALSTKFWAHVCGQTNLTVAEFNACMGIEGRTCN